MSRQIANRRDKQKMYVSNGTLFHPVEILPPGEGGGGIENITGDATLEITKPSKNTVNINTVKADKNHRGTVKVGANINVDSNGVISTHAPYVLPKATETVLGGVKVGTGLTVEEDGTLNAEAVDVPIATTERLGKVQVGANLQITEEGILSAFTSGAMNVIPIEPEPGWVINPVEYTEQTAPEPQLKVWQQSVYNFIVSKNAHPEMNDNGAIFIFQLNFRTNVVKGPVYNLVIPLIPAMRSTLTGTLYLDAQTFELKGFVPDESGWDRITGKSGDKWDVVGHYRVTFNRGLYESYSIQVVIGPKLTGQSATKYDNIEHYLSGQMNAVLIT